jgi:hypothetical protein
MYLGFIIFSENQIKLQKVAQLTKNAQSSHPVCSRLNLQRLDYGGDFFLAAAYSGKGHNQFYKIGR